VGELKIFNTITRTYIAMICQKYNYRNYKRIEYRVLEKNARWRRTPEGMRVHKDRRTLGH